MMNQVVSATPTLDPYVPRIIVTEPSPMVHDPDIIAANKPPSEEKARVIDETTEAADYEPSSRPTVEQFDTSTDSSGESLVSMPDHDQCEDHPINGLSTIQESLVNQDQDSDKTESVQGVECNSTSDDPRRKCFSGFRRCFYTFCLALNTIYATPFWLALMILPLSAIFMVSELFRMNCLLDVTPWLLLITGIMGILMLIMKVLNIILSTSWVDFLHLSKFLSATYFQGLFVFLYENCYFWIYSKSDDGCNSYFNTFTIWWNVTTIPVVVLISLFQVFAYSLNARD